ncbi:MAG: hypothetical protein CMN06_05435 [Roseibacillus sp.]|nr:hypothetical protein [Roseibacillus sp.]
MTEVELTRDLLMDAGGWKEMKAAREMHRGGLVRVAEYTDGWLEGSVLMGGKEKKVRMQVLSRTHMENKCGCLTARREGRVCAHAIAIGLEVIDPSQPVGEEGPGQDQEKVKSCWPRVEEEFKAEAYPVECRVMLPLKVKDSWDRGQMLVVFATEYEGEEHLLSSWSEDYALQVADQDSRLLVTLRRLFPETPPGAVNLRREQFLEVLDSLVGHPRVSFGKRHEATISCRPLRLSIECEEKRLRAQWPVGIESLVSEKDVWGVDMENRVCYPVALGLPESLRGVLDAGLRLDPVESFPLVSALGNWFDIEQSVPASLPQQGSPDVEVIFDGSFNHLEGRMTFIYGPNRRLAGQVEGALLEMGEEQVLASIALEKLAEDALRQWGFEGPSRGGKFVMRNPEEILRFFAHGLHRLDSDWIVIKGDRFSEFAKDVVPVRPVYNLTGSGENWMEVEIDYDTGDGGSIQREEIQRLLRTGQSSCSLGGNRKAVMDPDQLDDAMESIADCDPQQVVPGVFRVDAVQAAYLQHSAGDLGLPAADQLHPSEENGSALHLGSLKPVLRPYQREGVEWLWKLSEMRMGGVLADDMGLGKTLQSLAFIVARGGPSLVVCPSSLVQNWLEESAKFAPELEAVAIEGPARAETLEKSSAADLLVTSYALLRLDIDLYRERNFKVVILDEAQNIKNPEAQVSRAAFQLKAEHRFALTGTPMENSVTDLWSIMNFVLPGYLGDRSRFADRFEKPLARGNEPRLQRRLSRRLRPVVLRRLKEQVAKDLPQKIEQVRYCELSKTQREVYQSLLEEGRRMIAGSEGGQRRMLALTALLRLRQACCDLRLLNLPDVDEQNGSVKMQELSGLLDEAVEGGHRVLVFSQFVQMLQGIVPVLADRGFEFCYLDGQTRNRGDVVRRFQDSAIPVFLISLKAGGVGLNLTGADTVIHVDPWWNPAVEAQATDRAHRIGQKRVVTSYKLIARDTVEEKILALQQRKREMITSTLGDGSSGGNVGLDEEEILGLFG